MSPFQPTHDSNQSSLRKHSLPGIFTSRFHLRASPFNFSKRCRHAFAARSARRRLTGPSLRVASSRHGFGEALSPLYVGPPTLRRREQEESMNRAIPDFPCARPIDARSTRLFRVASYLYGFTSCSRGRVATASLRLWQLRIVLSSQSDGMQKGFLSVGHSPKFSQLRFRRAFVSR